MLAPSRRRRLLCHDLDVAIPARAETASPPPRRLDRGARLDGSRLYLILEAKVGSRSAPEVVEPALAGGVDVVQLREKGGDDDLVVETARALRDICHARGALLLVNDRPELALECGADGVHVGQDDLPVEEARSVLGPDLLVGVSTHSPAQIAAARESSADYLGVGPVHVTPTKPGAEPVGTELVRHAAEHAGKPFFAIGGIDAENVGEVVAAGATRVAVVRAIRDAPDPRVAAAELRAAMGREAEVGSLG
jgi:thiamine-phosphate pyrophosphorylase